MKPSLAAAITTMLLSINLTYAQQPAAAPAKESELVLLLVPVEVSSATMQAGCWATLYDQRNFKGDGVTMAGSVVVATTDKATGRYLRRNIDSLQIGPKATLTVFEHRLFKDRSVSFGPNTKEPGLIKKLGFTGRIESLRLDCLQ
jgi:hypothetical protein